MQQHASSVHRSSQKQYRTCHAARSCLDQKHLVGVELHQVLGDQVVQLGRHLHARGAAAHNDKGEQLLALLQSTRGT